MEVTLNQGAKIHIACQILHKLLVKISPAIGGAL